MLVSVIVIAVILIVAFSIYRYIDRKNSHLNEAEVNKIIADIHNQDRLIEKKLKPIIKKINKTARNGNTAYYPTSQENYDVITDLNRSELRNFFERHGYKILFQYSLYSMIYASDIAEISWGEENE